MKEILDARNGLTVVQNPSWKPGNLSHFFTTKKAGNASIERLDPVSHHGANRNTVVQSQENVAELFHQPPRKLTRPEQVHGSNVDWVQASSFQRSKQGLESIVPDLDGLFTTREDVIIMGYAADCPLLFFLVPDRAVGIVHASWKGIKDGIIGSVFETIDARNVASGTNIHCWISPSIHSCCYEVKEDFKQVMLKNQPDLKQCFENDQTMTFDLQKAIRLKLKSQDVPGEQITKSSFCTKCSPEYFYSYRRGGRSTGRMVGLISLRNVEIS